MATLKNIIAKKDKAVTASVAKFQQRMDGVISSINKDIAAAVRAYSKNAGTDLVGIEFTLGARAQLEGMLVDSGYYEAVGEFMGEYDGIIKSIQQQYNLSGYKLALGLTAATVINQLRQFDIDYFQNLGTQTTDALYRALYENTVSPVDFGTLVDAVRGTLEGSPLKKYSYTYANDTIMRFERSVNAMAAEKTGWKYVKYVGPDDAVTRPFCAEHVGNTYPIEEAQAMTNDLDMPAWTTGGGYNCRHSWIAVPTAG